MSAPLSRVTSSASSSGIFLDFDGTLSEIVATPDEARALEGVSDLLPALAARFGVVAIVSGRRAADVAARLGIAAGSSIRCYGLYGLEDLDGPSPAHVDALGLVERAMPAVERAAAHVPGALLEHKGLHVAIHYRGAPDQAAARRVLLERLGAVLPSAGLRILEGKRVVELAPERGPTKGDVVRAVVEAEGLAGILYAGDDVADLEAFAAIADLEGLGVAGIRIAVRSAETPDAVLRAADLVVDGPAGLRSVLERLAS